MFRSFSQIAPLFGQLRFIGSFLEVVLPSISRLPLGFRVEVSLLAALVMVRTPLYGLTIGFCMVVCVIYICLEFYQLQVCLGMSRFLISSMMASRLFNQAVWSFNMSRARSLYIHKQGFLITLFGRVILLASFFYLLYMGHVTSPQRCHHCAPSTLLPETYFTPLFHLGLATLGCLQTMD